MTDPLGLAEPGIVGRFLRHGVTELLRSATETTMGTRFPSERGPAGATGRQYESTLYRGASGVGIALLDLPGVRTRPAVVDLLDQVSAGLVASTPLTGPLRPGLYDGHAGVALFHLSRARHLRDREALNHARAIGARLAEVQPTRTDLISGAAGLGLMHLALYHATGDPDFRRAAHRAARFLEDTAVADPRGLAWPMRDPRDGDPHACDDPGEERELHLGLAHGSAGVCVFLCALAEETSTRRTTRLLTGAFRWLDAWAVRRADSVNWPRSIQHPDRFQAHWCHGATGVAQAYLARYRLTGERQALATAARAGLSAWRWALTHPREPVCHCHGIAGAVELMLDLSRHGAGRVWQDRAHTLGRRVARLGLAPRVVARHGAGLSLGMAGLVRVALRLAGYPVTSLLAPRRRPLRLPSPLRRNAKRRPQRHPLPVSPAVTRFIVDGAAAFLPSAVAPMRSGRAYVALGQPTAREARAAIGALRLAPAGGAYFESLQEVAQATAGLAHRYRDLVQPGVIGPAVLGPILREIAALSMEGDTRREKIRSVARLLRRSAVASLGTMLERLARDCSPSGSLAREVQGRLTRIRMVASDPHRFGQRIFELGWEGGPHFLYKPRPLTIDRQLAGASEREEDQTLASRCLTWLHPSVRHGRLPTHRLVAAGAWHGYAELVEPAEQASWRVEDSSLPASLGGRSAPPQATITQIPPGDARRFWYSAGLLTGHAFTLGVHDLHLENIVCGTTRTTPRLALHAVDLELAFATLRGVAATGLVDHAPESSRSHAGPEHHSHAGLSLSVSPHCAAYAEDWGLLAGRPARLAAPRGLVCWRFPHAARNPDGSLGYARQFGPFVRGFADQWRLLSDHAREVRSLLRDTLNGHPIRVVIKHTGRYAYAVDTRKLGPGARPGAAVLERLPDALPFRADERKQLAQLDIPYFFRYLGVKAGARSGLWQVASAEGRLTRGGPAPSAAGIGSDWDVVRRQVTWKQFASALVDLVNAVAPSGPFDFHDPALGIRATRQAEDARMVMIVLFGDRRDERFSCRAAPDGTVEWWID